MDASCIICNIINKNIKSFIVFENDALIAFLDHKPLFLGHCLLAPKKHYETLYDLPESYSSLLLPAIQKIGHAVTRGRQAEGTFMAINNIVSQSIAHLHIHIVPRKKRDGLKGFFWPRTKYKNEEEMQEVQLSIQHYL